LGFGSAGSNMLSLQNEAVGGDILLIPSNPTSSIGSARSVVVYNKLALRSSVAGFYSFMEFFPDWSNPTARRAWLGFGTDNLSFTISNEGVDASLQLLTNGANSVVYINNILRVAQGTDLFGAKIQTSGNIHALGAITSERFYQLRESTRPVGNPGHWRIYSEGGVLYLIDGAGARWRFNITAA
jgi:hypothetical protein